MNNNKLDFWAYYLRIVQAKINDEFKQYSRNYKRYLSLKAICLIRLSSEKKAPKF